MLIWLKRFCLQRSSLATAYGEVGYSQTMTSVLSTLGDAIQGTDVPVRSSALLISDIDSAVSFFACRPQHNFASSKSLPVEIVLVTAHLPGRPAA